MRSTETIDESTPLKKRVVRTKRTHSFLLKLVDVKWIVLMFCCTVMAIMYYILAMPAALHRQLHAIMPSDNFEMNFNLLFTVSYFPNMILPMFGGVFVDKYGEAKCLGAFCIVVLIGQAFTALGVSSMSWKLMLAGRLVFGLGAQNLIVANASLISKWFAGHEGVALGLSNVFSYAGVIATNIASPHLANSVNPPFAFWLGVMIEMVAIVLCMFIIVMDRNKKAQEQTSLVCSPMFSPIAYRHTSFTTQHATHITHDAATEYSQASMPSPGVTFAKNGHAGAPGGKLRGFKPTFWLLCASFLLVYGVVWSFTNVSSGILLERDFFLKPPPDCRLMYPNQCSSGSLAPEQGNPSIDLQGNTCPVGDNFAPVIPKSLDVTVKEDDASTSSLFDNTKYRFDTLSSSDIQCQDSFWVEACTMNYCQDQASATEKAGFYMSIPYLFTVALTSYLGLLADRTGYRTEMICFGSILLVVAHVLLAYPRSSPPVVPLVSQGLGYTICVAGLWPSVPFTVSADSVGLAFGIMMGVQNVGLALIPLIVAHLYWLGKNRYLPTVEIFFAACSVLAVLVGFALMATDKKTDKILGTPKIAIGFSRDKNEMVVVNNGRARALSEGSPCDAKGLVV